MQGSFFTVLLSPQAPKRSPLGPGGTEPGSDCPEGDQRGPREREAPPLHGKKSGFGMGHARRFRRVQIQKGTALISSSFACARGPLSPGDPHVPPLPGPQAQAGCPWPWPHPWPLASRAPGRRLNWRIAAAGAPGPAGKKKKGPAKEAAPGLGVPFPGPQVHTPLGCLKCTPPWGALCIPASQV